VINLDWRHRDTLDAPMDRAAQVPPRSAARRSGHRC